MRGLIGLFDFTLIDAVFEFGSYSLLPESLKLYMSVGLAMPYVATALRTPEGRV